MTTRQRKTASAGARRSTITGNACQPAGDRQVVLVLQGGGALGAYQAGVYEGLHEAGIEPDWVIGTSIGAINAALVAGNAPQHRLERLRAFWDMVAHKGLPALWPGLPGLPTFWTTLSAINQGLPGFFAPNHRAWLSPHLALGEETSGYYETSRMRDTLAGLVDDHLLTACSPRLTVGAVNVKTGRMRYFDIGDELFWDGGIYSNTPVEAVFDDNPRRNSLVFAVQLWQPDGDAPQSMWQVGGWQKDIQFSSRPDSQVQRQAQIDQLRHIVRELTRQLPASALAQPDVRDMAGYGCGTVMHLMRLVVPRLPDEDHTKDMHFNVARIQQRWQAGLNDARRTLARQAWLEPVGPMDGLVVHDLSTDTPIPQEIR